MDRLHFRSATDAAGFTMLSNLVLLDTALSDGAKVTYLVLLHHARQSARCFPGQGTLAAERGVSDRSIRTHLVELVGRGLVTVERRGRAKSNYYWLESLEEVYRKNSSTQDFDRKNSSATDRKQTSGPNRMLEGNEAISERDEAMLNVGGKLKTNSKNSHTNPPADPDADAIRQAMTLTGDTHSLRRFTQLREICTDNGKTGCWTEALRSTERAIKRGTVEPEKRGAYFCVAVVRQLERKGVTVASGTPGERDQVRSLIAASLSNTEATANG
jgi:hypothetical protein